MNRHLKKKIQSKKKVQNQLPGIPEEIHELESSEILELISRKMVLWIYQRSESDTAMAYSIPEMLKILEQIKNADEAIKLMEYGNMEIEFNKDDFKEILFDKDLEILEDYFNAET